MSPSSSFKNNPLGLTGRPKPAIALGIFFLVSLAASWALIKAVDVTPFHRDESGWIASGVYYTKLASALDLRWEKWRCIECRQWGSLNLHVGKWLIGLPLLLNPENATLWSDSTSLRYYDFKMPYEENVRAGNIPPERILHLARVSCAIFGVLCCLLVFAIGYLAGGTWVALIASCLLIFNGTFVIHVTRAMTDVHYVFFLLALCAFVITMGFAGPVIFKLRISLLCGLILGLAASVKVTGLVIGGAFLAAVLVYNKVVCTGKNRFRWTSLIIPGLVALMVIYLLNPYFWPSFGDFRIAVAASEVKSLLTNLRQGNLDAEGIRERYPHLSNVGRLAEFPGQFIRWKRLMKIQAKSTGAGWNKSRLVSIHKQLFLHFSTFPMEWMFFVIGLVYLGRSMCNSLRNKCYSACSIVLVFFFINYALIVFFLELNWDRYYLSTIAASAVVVAFGLVESVTFVSRRLFTLSRFLTRKSD